MILLNEYRFSMNLGPGYKGDVWALGGKVYNHPRYADGEHVHLSTPKEFDEANLTVRTFSGSLYQLLEPDVSVSREAVIEEIKEVIATGGYQRY